MKLQTIRDEVGDCRRCRLADTRTNIVFGSGPDHSAWLFVGEAPGRDEDLQGTPFVGRSGKLLDELLRELGWRRDLVGVINTVMCRPPGNRDPEPDEKAACEPFLLKKIQAIKPVVITTLGRVATNSLRGIQMSIGEARRHPFEFHGAKVIPTFHPSYVLHGALHARTEMLHDFVHAISVLAEKGVVP